MNVKELRKELADLPDDAIVDVRLPACNCQESGDVVVEYACALAVHEGPNKGAWLTLVLENA